MYAYNATTSAWLFITLKKAPTPRYYHGFTATYVGTSKAVLYVHGGLDTNGEPPRSRPRPVTMLLNVRGRRGIRLLALLAILIIAPLVSRRCYC